MMSELHCSFGANNTAESVRYLSITLLNFCTAIVVVVVSIFA